MKNRIIAGVNLFLSPQCSQAKKRHADSSHRYTLKTLAWHDFAPEKRLTCKMPYLKIMPPCV